MRKFLREVFSENGVGSFSRVASGLHMVAGITWISHVVWHSHALPDIGALGGVTAFVASPYAANKISNAIAGNRAGDAKPSAS